MSRHEEDDQRDLHRFTRPLPNDRVRRLKISAAAWAIGSVVVTTLWAVNQWQASGAFERFGGRS